MLIRSQNVYNEGLRLQDVAHFDYSTFKNRGSHVYPNDILLNITGASIGRCAIVPSDFGDADVNQHVLILRQVLLDPLHYIHLVITSPVVQDAIMDVQVGATKEGLSASKASKLLLPIPPLKEQRRILASTEDMLPLILQYDALETAREKLDAELPERLRKSILQMAVQGKLVPQDPADEPASVLLERIREKRRGLIAEGKLKAPKGGESVIYRASDGGYYEKRIDAKGRESEPVCIDDEIPFEIPDSWEWVRLGSICSHIVDGDHNPPANSGKGIPILSAANVHNGKLHIDEAARWITEADYKKAYKRLSTSKGNVLMTIVGTIGRTAVLDTDEPFALQRSVSVIAQLCMIPQYLAYALESYIDYLQSISSGTAQKGIYLGTLSNLLIPIPSVNEQSRIYAALSEALPLITNQ